MTRAIYIVCIILIVLVVNYNATPLVAPLIAITWLLRGILYLLAVVFLWIFLERKEEKRK